jgi:hypothetical protein
MNYFDKNICRVTYTHTDYSDVWCAYFGEMEKFSNFKLDHYICINSNKKHYSSFFPSSTKTLLYNDKFKYAARLKNCLDQIKNYKYILFDHEDMFLYAKPNLKKILKYYKLIKNGKYDSIRLAKDSISTALVSKYDKTLYEISDNSNWFFSIQPSIWHLAKFKKILEINQDFNIWELESKCQEIVKKMNLKIAYSYDNSKKRGTAHYDNKIYPYIATAIVKGKWNTPEYSSELEKIFNKYLINSQLRGEYKVRQNILFSNYFWKVINFLK